MSRAVFETGARRALTPRERAVEEQTIKAKLAPMVAEARRLQGR